MPWVGINLVFSKHLCRRGCVDDTMSRSFIDDVGCMADWVRPQVDVNAPEHR